MALGAQASDVTRMVLGQGGVLAIVGVVLGLAGALALNRVMESLLFDVNTTDPATYVGVSLALLAVAAVATLVPALKAAGVDPIEALRSE